MQADVTNALCASPKIVERFLRVFPTQRLDDRPEADRYTPREVVAHLADWEQVVLDRVRVANIQPGRAVPDEDPGERAVAHHYGDKDVFHEAEVFESRRQTTMEYLRGLDEPDFQKTFVHPVHGEMTIEAYMVNILAHDVYHMDQLSCFFATEAATIL